MSPARGLFWVNVVMLGLPSMKNSRISHANTGLLIPINPCTLGSFRVAGLENILTQKNTVGFLEGDSDSHFLASPTTYLAQAYVWMPLFSPAPHTRTHTHMHTCEHTSHQLLLQLTCS